jgi:nitronate monooxygenase
LVAGARGRHAWESGETDAGVMTAGLVVGLIDDVPDCALLIERTVRDALAHLQRAAGWAGASGAR